MGPHSFRFTDRLPSGARPTRAARAFAFVASLLATLLAGPAPAAVAPARPSAFALATVSPAEGPALGTSFLKGLIPSPYEMFSPCFDGSPVRLRGPRGLLIVPVSAEPMEDGVHYVVAEGPAGEPGATRVLAWKDYRGVDHWKQQNESAGSLVGLVVGLGVGAAVMYPLVKDEVDNSGFSLFPAPGAVGKFIVGTAVFGGVGALIGSRLDPPSGAHWVRCNK